MNDTEKILQEMRSMNAALSSKIEKSETEVLKAFKSVEKKVSKLEEELKSLKNDKSVLEQQVGTLEDKVEDLERKLKTKNIFIYGLDYIEHETRSTLEQHSINTLMELTQVEIKVEDIDIVRRIGKTPSENSSKPQPVLLTFTSERKRHEVLKNSSKLKGSNLRITPDYTKKILNDRNMLRNYMIQARNSGFSAKINSNKLIVNGESYTLEDLENFDFSTPSPEDICEPPFVENTEQSSSSAQTNIPEEPTQLTDFSGLKKSSRKKTSLKTHSSAPKKLVKIKQSVNRPSIKNYLRSHSTNPT